jgi:WD40 repeat protein
VARVPDAHAGAVLALAAVEDPDPDAPFPWFVSTSIDGTIATWHVEEEVTEARPDASVVSDEKSDDGVRVKNENEKEKEKKYVLVRDACFGDDDAPWWCLSIDEEWLYAGTHTRNVRVRLAVDSELDPLPGGIGDHTGWVRALASLPKTEKELFDNESRVVRFGDKWRFSAACNVVRVWQDSLEFEEEDANAEDDADAEDARGRFLSKNTSALVDVAATKIFTGDILCLASAVSHGSSSLFAPANEHERQPLERFLVAGVADGTVRGWRVLEAEEGKRDAPVMVEIETRSSDEEKKRTDSVAHADLRGGRVTAIHALSGPAPGCLFVAGCRDGTIGCVDAKTLKKHPRVMAHGGPSEHDHFDQERRDLKKNSRGVSCLCEGPDGTVCSGGNDSSGVPLRVWRPVVESNRATSGTRAVPGSIPGGVDPVVTLAECGRYAGWVVSVKNENDEKKKDAPSPSARAACAAKRNGRVVGVLVGEEHGGLALYAF